MRKLSYWIASVVLVAVVALLFAPSHGKAQERGQAPAERPLVNVQVLKGMTRPQVVQVMQGINVQLGVACTFCHVQNNGQNDFPAEDKQHKLIAREMMRMVQTINEQQAVATVARKVECFTCHRGAAGIPVTPVPPPPAAPAAAPARGAAPGN
jgi:hypothetical protein